MSEEVRQSGKKWKQGHRQTSKKKKTRVIEKKGQK